MVRWAGFWNCYKIRYLINTSCTTRKSTTHIKWGQYNMKYKNCEKLRYHKICHPIKTVFSSLKWNQTRIETGNYSDRRSVWNFSGAVSMGSVGLTEPISFQKRIQNQRKRDDIKKLFFLFCNEPKFPIPFIEKPNGVTELGSKGPRYRCIPNKWAGKRTIKFLTFVYWRARAPNNTEGTGRQTKINKF